MRNEPLSFGIPLHGALWYSDEILKEISFFPFHLTLLTDYLKARRKNQSGDLITVSSKVQSSDVGAFSFQDFYFIRRWWATFDTSWVVIPLISVTNLQRVNVFLPINPLRELTWLYSREILWKGLGYTRKPFSRSHVTRSYWGGKNYNFRKSRPSPFDLLSAVTSFSNPLRVNVLLTSLSEVYFLAQKTFQWVQVTPENPNSFVPHWSLHHIQGILSSVTTT